ncbi:hypothetical protein VTJ04DRAFT_4574 [Mycothermus thermophilus]|uniref:uncharacterized protein n=1 Tax=Humicola insolens TaxID=85995 RepID=UPI00374228EF
MAPAAIFLCFGLLTCYHFWVAFRSLCFSFGWILFFLSSILSLTIFRYSSLDTAGTGKRDGHFCLIFFLFCFGNDDNDGDDDDDDALRHTMSEHHASCQRWQAVSRTGEGGDGMGLMLVKLPNATLAR